jgi:nitrate reductase cytochrome c-type subunit
MGPNPPARCLECHSADYRIAVEAGKTPPTGAEAKYGITCVGCHTPHDNGTAVGEWSEEFHPQLRTDSQDTLCIECHNGELPEGTEAVPGTEIHHPMKEMIEGYGAIGVPQIPSVHKDKCVQCHMPPTTTSPTGGNHTFQIIEPEVAAEAVPNPLVTNSPTPKMPYSSCSGANGCHTRSKGPDGTYDRYALYLQDTIEQRQSWTMTKIDQVWDELDAAAAKLGYADTDAAHTALVAIPESDWSTAQRLFLSSYTNVEFVQSEGSYGIHNWAYSVQVVNTAMNQAKAVTAPEPRKWIISLKASRSSVNKNRQKVFFRGAVQTGWGVAASGKIKLQRRMAGQSWRNWKSQTLATNGSYKIVQKLNFKKGKWYFRAVMPGDGGLNLTNNSRRVTVRVK